MTTSLVLPSRGKAAKLVDERNLPVHLKCSSCLQPLFNTFQTPHGCRLCQTCVDKLPAQEKVPCPGKTDACKDKDEMTDICQATCSLDLATRREVGKLNVYCPNRSDGCGAQFLWREVESHLNNCGFEKVECDMCGEKPLKKDLVKHQTTECRQRRVNCKDCHVEVVFGVMETEHRNVQSSSCCPAFAAPCPHCGDGQMRRPDYLRHLSECRQKPTACKFAHLGCDFVAAAAKLDAHHRDSVDRHLEMIDKRLRATATAQASAVAVSEAAAAMSAIPQAGAVREAAELERKALNIFAVFKRLQPNVATWALKTIELEELMKAFGGASGFKTVLKAMDDKLRQLEAAERASGSSGPATAASIATESARMLERMKAIELRFDALELTSFDGYLTWKITGVAARRMEARTGSPASLFSPPFFSRRYGYMFRVRVFLNGHDGAEGSHISVQLVVMQSEYDDVLDWPLLADVTFRLVSPRSRADDVVSKTTLDAQRPTGADDLTVNVGVSKFAKITTVEEKFVRNDCLYLETDVEPRPTDGNRRSRRR